MKLSLFSTLQGYRKEYLPKDIFSGIIIAAVSIPISMGYAQISGIPAVYGLYGSVLPILLFALFSTSRQFIFGVDAAPAAIVGGALSTLGIAAESEAAMDYVPAIALLQVCGCLSSFCFTQIRSWTLSPHLLWAVLSAVSQLPSS